ncbi:MAG: hypothetical protein IJU72_08065 [Bacteroidales bacterium]|nr:hypothetical protein [Bacteroidales bacterium]
MDKLPIILEYIWAVLAVVCLVLGIHSSLRVGFNVSYMFFVLSVLAMAMFGFRRFKRTRSKRS